MSKHAHRGMATNAMADLIPQALLHNPTAPRDRDSFRRAREEEERLRKVREEQEKARKTRIVDWDATKRKMFEQRAAYNSGKELPLRVRPVALALCEKIYELYFMHYNKKLLTPCGNGFRTSLRSLSTLIGGACTKTVITHLKRLHEADLIGPVPGTKFEQLEVFVNPKFVLFKEPPA